MIVPIIDAISKDTLDVIRERLKVAEFVGGSETGGPDAAGIKTNMQVRGNSVVHRELSAYLIKRLLDNPVFQQVAFPLRIGQLHFSKYDRDMFYGDHIDEPVMNRGYPDQFRSDISMTVFLSDADEYDGGELVANTDATPQMYKLNAGSVLLYPSTSLHHVNPVSRGTRMVAVGWVQSFIRHADQRQMLWDVTKLIDTLQVMLAGQQAARHPAYITAKKIRANLVREWYEG
jgi:PKHD-type hydroxylase